MPISGGSANRCCFGAEPSNGGNCDGMTGHASGAQVHRRSRLLLSLVSDTSEHHDEPVDLDEIEAQLAEVELMLERLDKPNA